MQFTTKIIDFSCIEILFCSMKCFRNLFFIKRKTAKDLFSLFLESYDRCVSQGAGKVERL